MQRREDAQLFDFVQCGIVDQGRIAESFTTVSNTMTDSADFIQRADDLVIQ